MLIANAASLGALFLLHSIVRRSGRDASEADRAVWLLAFWPYSYFLSAPFSESLFLVLLLLSLLAVMNNRSIGAGALFALTTACRPTGLLMLPGFLVLLYQRGLLFTRRGLIGMLLSPLGGILYMLFLWYWIGDPLAFVHNQLLWGRKLSLSSAFSLPPHLSASHLLAPWDGTLLNSCSGLLALAIAAALFLTRQWGFALIILVPLSTAFLSGQTVSLGRYVMSLFPIFLFLASILRSEESFRGVLAAFSVLLGAMVLLYAMHVTLAMT
jgi:Gpi18-like mannosyltransferase